MKKKILTIGFIFALLIIGSIFVNAFSNTIDNDENFKTNIDGTCTNCSGTCDLNCYASENCNEICNIISSKSCNDKQQCHIESINICQESSNCVQNGQTNRKCNIGGYTRSNSCNG